jgi:diguanylate cyclase (GGDEF)-like protein
MDINVGLRSVVLDAVTGGIIVLDANGCVLVWNRWMVEHGAIAEDLAIGRPFFELFPELAASRLGASVTMALSHRLAGLVSPSLQPPPLPLYRSPVDRQQDRRLWQMIHVTPIHMAGMPACALHIQDVTTAVLRERRLREQSAELADRNAELQQQLQEIQALQHEIAAMHARDPLTGVLDRRHAEEFCLASLARAEAEDAPLVLAIVDVDRLKDINESHGHASGDATLKAAASLLRELLPPAAGVGRLDSDEFLVVLPGMEIEAVRNWAEAVRHRFAALQIETKEGSVSATLSAGLSAFPHHGRTFEELMQSLNLALFLTRHEGYDRVITFGEDLADIF